MNPYEFPMQKALVTIQRFGKLTCRALGRKIKVDDEHIDEIINHLVSVNAIERYTNYRVRFIYEAPLHHAIPIACPFCGVNITDDNMSMATDVKGNPICSACFERNGDKCQRCDALVERKCKSCGAVQVMKLQFIPRSPICCKCAMSLQAGKSLSQETRDKMSAAQKGIPKLSTRGPRPSMQRENNPNWQGGTSYGKYCYKFNDRFKEIIRDKFDRTCFICGKSEEENGKKLSIHHVSYAKRCMCDGVECKFVPLCVSCHGRTGSDRYAWERLLMDVLAYEGWLDDGI